MEACPFCNYELGTIDYCPTCLKHRRLSAPAQEEKEMEFECRCKKCDCRFMSNRNNSRLCNACGPKLAAELRERWDRAYFAALTGVSYHIEETEGAIVTTAKNAANETIRRHADMMASRDVVIAEVVG